MTWFQQVHTYADLSVFFISEFIEGQKAKQNVLLLSTLAKKIFFDLLKLAAAIVGRLA
jgi:hypothetical protein